MINSKFNSRKYIAFYVCLIIFMVLIYSTEYVPNELAISIGMLYTMYVTSNTISKKLDDNNGTTKQ